MSDDKRGERNSLKPVKLASTSDLVVAALREESLRNEENVLLGSEEDLFLRLGVSRPTLREAARVLEHQELLTIRRGRNGGYFTRRPRAGTIAYLAAVVLRAEKATPAQVAELHVILSVTAARRACDCRDADARHTLKAMSEFAAANPVARTPEAFRQEEFNFNNHVAAMAGNPVLALFVNIVNEFGHVQYEVLVWQQPERRATAARLRNELAEAILRGDIETAEKIAHQRATPFPRWIDEDLKSSLQARQSETRRRSRRAQASGD